MPARRLKKPSDVRRYIASLINRTERGEVDPALAGRLGYLSNILIRAVQSAEIEERLDKIEAKIRGGK